MNPSLPNSPMASLLMSLGGNIDFKDLKLSGDAASGLSDFSSLLDEMQLQSLDTGNNGGIPSALAAISEGQNLPLNLPLSLPIEKDTALSGADVSLLAAGESLDTSDQALMGDTLMAQIQKNQEMFAAAQAQENALNNPMLTPNSMLLQLAASMQRQLQNRLQQAQTSMAGPIPTTSPIPVPFSAGQMQPHPVPSPPSQAVVQEVVSNTGSPAASRPGSVVGSNADEAQVIVKTESVDEDGPSTSPAIVTTENNDINGNTEIPPPAVTPRSTASGQEVVVEPASPLGEDSGLQIADQTIATEASEARSASVKSERIDDGAKSTHSAHSNNSASRKRKLEDPGIGHMMSEQLLQQRLAQAARPSIPFPFGLSQFQVAHLALLQFITHLLRHASDAPQADHPTS